MRDFVASTNRNRKIFGDMHAAHRVSYQPFIPRYFLLRTLRLLRDRIAQKPSEEPLHERNAPGEHQHPKQEPEEAGQNPHACVPVTGKMPSLDGEASVCNGKRVGQTKMSDFNRLRGGLVTAIVAK